MDKQTSPKNPLGYMENSNNKNSNQDNLNVCPCCSNEEISVGAKYCKICGLPLSSVRLLERRKPYANSR